MLSFKRANSFSLISLLIFSFGSSAQSKIHFTDYRVFLSTQKNKADYQIFNQGNSPATCSVDIVDYSVEENGVLKLVKDEINKPKTSAKELIKVSPRKVNIEPTSFQKLKIFAKRLRSQPKGEWVSYLELSCEDKERNLKAGINITPKFKYHIPIVVRNGDLSATPVIKDLSLTKKNGRSEVTLTLLKEGNRSLYGELTILNSEGSEIAKQSGISHYLQSKELFLSLPIPNKVKTPITVRFEEDSKYGGNSAVSVELK